MNDSIPDLDALLAVMREIRAYIARPDNVFLYSGWKNHEEALREIDEMIAALVAGQVPPYLGGVFAPTGPTQELSIDSGWGGEFIALSIRFDAAMIDR